MPLPPGTLGEIVARGPQVMQGYWNLPEESREALRGGFMHTGDAGVMDEEGFVYIQDRVKDMIVSVARTSTPARSRRCSSPTPPSPTPPSSASPTRRGARP